MNKSKFFLKLTKLVYYISSVVSSIILLSTDYYIVGIINLVCMFLFEINYKIFINVIDKFFIKVNELNKTLKKLDKK